MKNNISLAFALALLFTGMFCFLFNVNEKIMFGVSFSSFTFSGISIILSFLNKKKYELLYAIPFIILLCFCCYGDLFMKNVEIKEMINSGLPNAITFFSFGTVFIAENISKHNEREIEKKKNEKLVEENINYCEQIVKLTNNYIKLLEDKKIVLDTDSKDFIRNIVDLSQEKVRQSTIIYELLKLRKNNYDIDDINKVFIDSSNVIKIKKYNNKH